MPFDTCNYILSQRNYHAIFQKFENLRIIVVKQGCTAEEVSDVVNETIGKMMKNTVNFCCQTGLLEEIGWRTGVQTQ
jgi:hypothetical protein